MSKLDHQHDLLVEQEPHYDQLEPGSLRFFRDASGRFRLTIEGDRSYLDVKAVRVFPLTHPERYTAFLSGKDKVIGMLIDTSVLDEASQEVIREDLERRYFTPTIRRVVSLREEYGAIYSVVETDHGEREFVAKGIRDTIEDLGDGELLFADVDGNRFRIEDWRALDVRSRRLLERVV